MLYFLLLTAGFEAAQRRSKNAYWCSEKPSSFSTKVICFNTGLKLSIVQLCPEPLNAEVLTLDTDMYLFVMHSL